MQFFSALALTLTLFVACKSNKPGGGTVAEDFALEIRHTGCRGNCPNYRINVDASGKAKWYGHHAVEMMGNYSKQLDKNVVAELAKTLDDYKFWEFEDLYGGGVADLPSVITTATANGKTKKVEDIREAPQSLKEMEARLETLIGKDGWEKDQ